MGAVEGILTNYLKLGVGPVADVRVGLCFGNIDRPLQRALALLFTGYSVRGTKIQKIG